MELSVLERLMVMNLLPKEGNFMNLKIIRVARESLSFTEEEHKLLNFTQEGEQAQWEDGTVGDKDIKIGEVATTLIVKELKKLNDEEKLTAEHESIYEKFIE